MSQRAWFLSLLFVGLSYLSPLLGDDALQVRELRERAAKLLREAVDSDSEEEVRDLKKQAADLHRKAEALVRRLHEDEKGVDDRERHKDKDEPRREDERREGGKNESQRREEQDECEDDKKHRDGEKEDRDDAKERRESEKERGDGERNVERRETEHPEAERRVEQQREEARREDDGRDEVPAPLMESLVELRQQLLELHHAGKHDFAELLERQTKELANLMRDRRFDQVVELTERLLHEVSDAPKPERTPAETGPTLLPRPEAPRIAPPVDVVRPLSEQCSPQQRIPHLLQAAEHLQAACMPEQAADLRRLAEELQRHSQCCPEVEELRGQVRELSEQVQSTQERIERIENMLREREPSIK